MSIQNSEKILLEFLKNPEPQVVALKGTWGSGKTYFWNEFLKKHKEDSSLTFKKYSYCSLFGVNAINDIKYSIFENEISKNKIGEDINWDNSKMELAKKKVIQLFRTSPVNEYSGMGLLFINTKEQSLLCFDDFERMINDELVISNLLGLISELKESRKCKIVIIFNEDELGKKENYYARFKEKIIDIEIEFSPTPEECAKKAYPGFSDKNNYDSILYDCAIKLKVKNIRILKKIKKIVSLIGPLTDTLNPSVFQQVLSSASMLIYCYLGNPNNERNCMIPSIDYLLKYSPFDSYFKKKNGEEVGPNEGNWEEIISAYGWTNTDELDREILNIIKRGYVIEEIFNKLASDLNGSFNAGDINKKYDDIWRNVYHGGFRDNENEFFDKFITLFWEYSEYLSISQLNDAVSIFRELEEDGRAEDLIGYYIHANAKNEEKIKTEGIGFYLNNPLDTSIKERLLLSYRALKNIPTLKELMDILTEKDFPSSDNESILFSATEDNIYDLFNGLEGKKFDNYRSILFKYKNVSNAPEEWKKLTERTTNALKRFGTNKINKRRLKSYGIE